MLRKRQAFPVLSVCESRSPSPSLAVTTQEDFRSVRLPPSPALPACPDWSHHRHPRVTPEQEQRGARDSEAHGH